WSCASRLSSASGRKRAVFQTGTAMLISSGVGIAHFRRQYVARAHAQRQRELAFLPAPPQRALGGVERGADLAQAAGVGYRIAAHAVAIQRLFQMADGAALGQPQ